MTDYLDSQEFLALLNQYRYAQLWNTVQHDKALEAIKAYIRAENAALLKKLHNAEQVIYWTALPPSQHRAARR